MSALDTDFNSCEPCPGCSICLSPEGIARENRRRAARVAALRANRVKMAVSALTTDHSSPITPSPALWAELFHGGQFRASFVSAGEAVRCASAFGSQACIVIDSQMREQWLADDMTVATVEEFPSHPSRAERSLREIADRADLLCLALADGRLVLWYRDAKAFSVFPPDVKFACLSEIGPLPDSLTPSTP